MIGDALVLCVITISLLATLVIGSIIYLYHNPVEPVDPAFYATEDFDI